MELTQPKTLLNELITKLDQNAYSLLPAGLIHGKSGLALLYQLLDIHQGRPQYASAIHSLLQAINTEITDRKDAGFESGLSGIGWMAEWMAKKGVEEAISNEILYKTDGIVYYNTLYQAETSCSLLHGTLGRLVYFLHREKGKNMTVVDYLYICLKRSKILLTDDLEEMFEALADGTILETNTPGMTDIANLLFVLPAINDINHITINRLHTYILQQAAVLLQQYHKTNEKVHQPDALYLAYALLEGATKLNQQHYIQTANTYIQALSQDTTQNNGADTATQIKQLKINTLLFLRTGNLSYQQKAKALLSALPTTHLPFSLHNGLGAVLLALIALDAPSQSNSFMELLYL